MSNNLLEKLKNLREEIAEEEDKPLYMVFPNSTLKATAEAEPESRDDLLDIKGWGEKKVKRYGDRFLSVVNGLEGEDKGAQSKLLEESLKASSKEGDEESHVFTVSSYLELINVGLKKSEARVKGEVTSVNERKKYVRFKIKDAENESILKCFMWSNDYNISGVELEEGMEVIVEGHPEVYKPYGEFSFRTDSVELVGEGALKKAYEKLKKKLKEEGIFKEERKRGLPDFPKDIGVITSLRGGTVIHDFENNLSKFGFKIKGIDARVEGKKAVKSLLAALKKAEGLDIDVLVVIRGGGSIESLQAFDNESLVREVVNFPVPVVAGIGHHEDVPLVAMAADARASTPQGVAEMLSEPWEKARNDLRVYERDLISNFENRLNAMERQVTKLSQKLQESFAEIIKAFRRAYSKFRDKVNSFGYKITQTKESVDRTGDNLVLEMETMIERAEDDIDSAEKTIRMNDPRRQLDLGYSIVSRDGSVIKSIEGVSIDDDIDIQVSDGKISSTVEDKENNDNN